MAAPADPPRRLTREEIELRNSRVFLLFLAGNSEREIGRAVGLAHSRVHEIIKKELKDAGRHRRLLTDQALAIYQHRLEILLKMVWPKAAAQDLRAVRVAAGLLQQQAQLYNFEEERLGAIPPVGEADMPDEVTEPEADELARYRNRHRRAEGS